MPINGQMSRVISDKRKERNCASHVNRAGADARTKLNAVGLRNAGPPDDGSRRHGKG